MRPDRLVSCGGTLRRAGSPQTIRLRFQGLPPTHLSETLVPAREGRHGSMKTPGRSAWEVYSRGGTHRSMWVPETSPDAVIRADTRQPRGLFMFLDQVRSISLTSFPHGPGNCQSFTSHRKGGIARRGSSSNQSFEHLGERIVAHANRRRRDPLGHVLQPTVVVPIQMHWAIAVGLAGLGETGLVPLQPQPR